jgi:serine/threonine-protein kinase RsbW
MEIKMALSLPRDASSVPVTRQVLDCCLERLGVLPDTRADIALALTEACANVIQHAGPGQEYEVVATTRQGRCVIEVVDTGGRAPEPAVRRRPDEDTLMSEHGRGLKIIDAVTDELSLMENDTAGTTVHFEKVLDWVPGALAEQLSAVGR